MTKFFAAIGAAFLLTIPLPAQSAQSGPSGAQCQQIRDAVATYGYAAAKRYAVIHYGAQAARQGDRCLGKKYVVKVKAKRKVH